ncbi:glycine--tRNA ligase subunit beta [Myxacorys almedinensis]|uniref:Glycine--tRNA ligase beta subunit n=1 Tax=Myxacorys almedinensis A TaxID=2690445 RepID=A0A8J8CGU1_9CYAN|nr:glycine--tRNA ligase subunit beta [Myxacorys almedinensis]NDJ15949.1 glycine--tRNA ligase subunit beta [Myxacorys almedinensis A]
MPSFLLEVGTEELPARFVDEALNQWRSRLPKLLTELNLTSEAIEYYGTPRRLAVLIKGLPSQQPDQDEEVKGPPAKTAFKDGQPTKAAEGFAQKQGVSLDALEIRPTEKGDFVFVQKRIKGRAIADLFTEQVPQWITGLDGKRFMRWSDGDLKFSRPIRWLVALIDDEVLPIAIVSHSISYHSSRQSLGHRVLHPNPVSIPNAEAYVSTLASAFVNVDPQQRQTTIESQVRAAAEQVGGIAIVNPDLLREVTNLVEYPSAVVGKFDAEFLEIPSEVVTTEMESHQRYFPVCQKGSKELLPYFITASNGDPKKADIIAAGNERVIRARLSDGKFFFDADRKVPLESYLPKLETVTFQADLGSVRSKVDRIGAIASQLATQLNITGETSTHIQRAALLCKADLVTQMVGEFPELQGVMGEKYARSSGEPEAVAVAISEHYLPKGAGDALPQTIVGQVVGLADRLDTLVGIFGLGLIPSGSSDPFALRRAATAIVNITWAANLNLNLNELLDAIVTTSDQLKLTPEDLLKQLKEFFLQRVETLLREDRTIDYDLVNAVLGENDQAYTERALSNLLDVRDRASFLQTIRNDGRLSAIYETVNRASRLAAQGNLDTQQLDPTAVVRPDLFQKNSEKAFYDALQQLNQTMQGHADYAKLIDALSQSAPTVSRFFDGEDSVLVMDDDPDIKQNRLNLLGILRNHGRVLADFGAIAKQAS